MRGAQKRTSEPNKRSSAALLRATRECVMSPQIATLQARQRAQRLADGERVEQRLRRMLVRTVAAVDHAAADALGDELRRA